MAHWSPDMQQQLETFSYLYHFITAEGVLESLGELLTKDFYAWATRAMSAVRQSPSSHLAPSLGPHTSKVAAAWSDSEDVVEVFIADDTTEKVVAVRDFDHQSYTRDEFKLTFLQVEGVKIRLASSLELIKTS